MRYLRIPSSRLKVLAPLLIPFILLQGCASHFTTFRDPDTNAAITRMVGNRLAGGIPSLELNAQRYEKSGQISYSLIVRYSGMALLEIPAGETLFIIIKENRTALAGKGSEGRRNTLSVGLFEEVAYYHEVDPGIIQMMAEANDVQVEVKGSTSTSKRYFSKNNMLRFQEFYTRYVHGQTPHP